MMKKRKYLNYTTYQFILLKITLIYKIIKSLLKKEKKNILFILLQHILYH